MDMTFKSRLKFECRLIGLDFKRWLGRRRAFFLWRWHRLWIRKDEFHSSLDGDLRIILYLKTPERQKYYENLAFRRLDSSQQKYLQRKHQDSPTKKQTRFDLLKRQQLQEFILVAVFYLT